jgi:hypothetical protein
MFSPKKWFYIKVDNYIIKNHSQDYIRKDLIQDEIQNRIKNAVDRNNFIRDEQETAKLKSQKTEYEIKEFGWKADIAEMEQEMTEVMEMRKNIIDYESELNKIAKQLVLITAENDHEGNKIVNSVSAAIGKIEKYGLRAKNVDKKLEKNKINYNEKLKIKG